MIHTVCIQCALKAFVDGQTDHRLWVFQETPAAHMLRCHPDPTTTWLERQQLVHMLCENVPPSTIH